MCKESTELLIHRTCCFGEMTILLQFFFIKMVLALSILTLIVESKNILCECTFFSFRMLIHNLCDYIC